MNWRETREVSHPGAIRLMAAITRRVPRNVARCLIPPIAAYYLVAAPVARRASLAYLTTVLGRPARWIDAWRHIRHFATVTLDRAYFLRGRFEQFQFDVVGHEHTDALRRLRTGAFLFGAHMGSFESLRAYARLHETPRIHMVMYEENARKLNAVLEAINPELAQDVIPLGRPDSMLRAHDALEHGAFACILADRLLSRSRASDIAWLPFLGRPAPFPLGPFRMAALLRRPVVLILGLYLGDNRYRLVFEPIFDFSSCGRGAERTAAVHEAVRRYVARIEHHCREHPLNWFNFFDFWNGPDDPGQTEHAAGTAAR